MLDVTDQGLFIPERARPLTRMIAQKFDAYDPNAAKHSSAI
jgi:oxygen-independent coproporphyrinogen-3 oxidase